MDLFFTATDIDGDTITVNRKDRVITATITGEDGHRTVILTEADIHRLTVELNLHRMRR